MKPIEFKAKGLTMRGNLFLADKPKKTAFLFLAGWTGQQNLKAAQMMANHGYSSMTFDMPGHGSSEGDINQLKIHEFLDFAVAAYDFFRSQIGQAQAIGAAGNSFGGYVAPLLSAKRPLGCISMRAPANYPDADFKDVKAKHANDDERYVLERWRRENLTPADNKALAALAQFRGPVQIIEAENDESVDAKTVQNYVAAVNSPSQLEYILWKGAPHSIGTDDKLQKEFENFLLAWADKTEVE